MWSTRRRRDAGSDWSEAHARCLGVFFSGEGLTETDDRGRPLNDASFLVLFNAHDDDIPFPLPRFLPGARWLTVMDTAYEHGLARGPTIEDGGVYPLRRRSLALPSSRGHASERRHAMPCGAEVRKAGARAFASGHREHARSSSAAGCVAADVRRRRGWREAWPERRLERIPYRVDGELEVPDPASRSKNRRRPRRERHRRPAAFDGRRDCAEGPGPGGDPRRACHPTHQAPSHPTEPSTASSLLEYRRSRVTAISSCHAGFPGRATGVRRRAPVRTRAEYGAHDDLSAHRCRASAQAHGPARRRLQHFGPEGITPRVRARSSPSGTHRVGSGINTTANRAPGVILHPNAL